MFARPLQRLELLDGYLKEFDAAGADRTGSEVKWQKKRDTPWKITDEFPAGEDSKGVCFLCSVVSRTAGSRDIANATVTMMTTILMIR